MTAKRLPILICGDAGPGRHALLARSDLEATWTDTVQGALAALRHIEPKVVLVRPSRVKGDVADLLRACERGPPCIVLLARDEWGVEGAYFARGASEAIELERSDLVLTAVGQYTGLAFAKEQRTRFETVVEVSVSDSNMVLETIDISASGAGIRGFPSVPVDTLARLSFVVRREPIVMWSRVVRGWIGADGVEMAGVRFIGMSEEQTKSLRSFVLEHNALLPQPGADYSNLFEETPDELESARVLRASEFVAQPSERASLSDPDVATIEKYVKAEDMSARDALDMPIWLLRVEESLSGIERDALAGKQAPSWARSAILIRVSLSRWRSNHPAAPFPSHLSVKAYDLFLDLGTVKDDSDVILAEAGKIRALILRELLSSPKGRRSEGLRASQYPTAAPPAHRVANH